MSSKTLLSPWRHIGSARRGFGAVGLCCAFFLLRLFDIHVGHKIHESGHQSIHETEEPVQYGRNNNKPSLLQALQQTMGNKIWFHNLGPARNHFGFYGLGFVLFLVPGCIRP